LFFGRCWLTVSPPPPVNFCDSGEMDAMQIAKLVMQIYANNVLNIDSIKNQIFLMGGAGETHVVLASYFSFHEIFMHFIRLVKSKPPPFYTKRFFYVLIKFQK
jgi:hypothetical protein